MGSPVLRLVSPARVPLALIVDTDPSSILSLHNLLGECQIRTLAVSNGADALEVLRTQAIDLVICGDLGGFHGVEVLEACQALFPQVPRVYLARKATPELHSEAILHGRVHATVTLAMHPVDLRNVIASLVGADIAARSLRRPTGRSGS